MTDEQIERMVERFLAWRLPDDFTPDCGISFKRHFNEDTDHPMRHEPVGTNLLNYNQALEMVRRMVEGIPQGIQGRRVLSVPLSEYLRLLRRPGDMSRILAMLRNSPNVEVVVDVESDEQHNNATANWYMQNGAKSVKLIRKEQGMNRYVEDLRNSSVRFKDLADKLAEQKAQPMTPVEKAMVRAAMAPKVREMLDFLLEKFVAGGNVTQSDEWDFLRTTFDDLANR